jgi:hypothetical protein
LAAHLSQYPKHAGLSPLRIGSTPFCRQGFSERPADCFAAGFRIVLHPMIKGSLRLILGEWKATTSVQHAAYAALLLALLLLPGCSDLALPNEEMPAAGAVPSYVSAVANYLKTLFKNQASYDAFEISPFRWVHSLKGWAWLTCVRFQDQGHPRVYAVFLKDGRIVDGRYAVVTDACDEQTYAAFDAMRGASRSGIQSPLY